MQALDKEPGTKRLGLEEAWVERGTLFIHNTMAIHKHLFTPSTGKQLDFPLLILRGKYGS